MRKKVKKEKEVFEEKEKKTENLGPLGFHCTLINSRTRDYTDT